MTAPNTTKLPSSLYVVPVPIGNLADITFRAVSTLANSDYIVCEDTRVTSKIFNLLNINPKNKLISYREQNHHLIAPKIIDLLKTKKSVSLVSDSGTPIISDPGIDLVKLVYKNKFKVVALPGASSLLTAVVSSGIESARFSYLGFLPRRKSKAKKIIEQPLLNGITVVINESPFRINETINMFLEFEQKNNCKLELSLHKEMTKKFEERIYGDIQHIKKLLDKTLIKGEWVIVAKVMKQE